MYFTGCALVAIQAVSFISGVRSFHLPSASRRGKSIMSASKVDSISSWSDLKKLSESSTVGSALSNEVSVRQQGGGSAFVQSKLRLFASNEKPKITLYRDHAGWCPYCQKTMLLIEEKEIPINIELVPMRSYGDKPAEFLRIVPSGLLPALTVETDDGRIQVITESQVIMELLDQWHPVSEGYKQMLPADDDEEGKRKYRKLAELERELFSWWCNLTFRPEGPSFSMPGSGGILGMLSGKKNEEMSGAMRGFLDCISKVDKELRATPGPWFFSDYDHPTMIDFIYVSHVERMLASCAFWKGLDLRSKEMRKEYPGINAWIDAFEKRESYLAFKSDYFTHVRDIPPQYGPGYSGGFKEKQIEYSKMITGEDGTSWALPLPHDDPLQPLYRGPPLPLAVLEAVGLTPSKDGSYDDCDSHVMAETARQMAGWKLAGNGNKVSRFAARGGSEGSRNPRKSFGAPLADPYAEPDNAVRPYVDSVLRVVCEVLLGSNESEQKHMASLTEYASQIQDSVPSNKVPDVISSLEYLRDRVGVPRDLPLVSARTLRAHLNWAIGVLN